MYRVWPRSRTAGGQWRGSLGAEGRERGGHWVDRVSQRSVKSPKLRQGESPRAGPQSRQRGATSPQMADQQGREVARLGEWRGGGAGKRPKEPGGQGVLRAVGPGRAPGKGWWSLSVFAPRELQVSPGEQLEGRGAAGRRGRSEQ